VKFDGNIAPVEVNELDLIDKNFDTSKFGTMWTPGEEAGMEKLQGFAKKVHSYKEMRSFPDIVSTSRLSPHYQFGEVSPYLAWHTINNAQDSTGRGVDHYLFEMGWREYGNY
jgi:deoxyribodipyrimidine photo-lyase